MRESEPATLDVLPTPAVRLAAGAVLGFMAFPLVALFQAGPSAPRLVLVLAAAAAFVVLYAAGIELVPLGSEVGPRAGLALVAALFALSLALSLGDRPDWSGQFIYTAAVAAVRLPRRTAGLTIAVCVAGAGATAGRDDIGHGVEMALWCVSVGLLVLGIVQLARLHAELEAARSEVARLAVAGERLRFARDLHDLLGHSLSLIALKSGLARRLLPADPERAAGEVADIESVTREALAEVREAVSGYRTPTVAAELAGARRALAAAGIEVDVDWPAVPLATGAEAVLAWALREASTNVVRHSGARSCAILLREDGGMAALEVRDDGRGTNGSPPGGGSGLAGLAERVERRGGSLHAGPSDEGGFALRVEVPNEERP